MKPAENQLIEALPHSDRLRLLAACEPFEMVLADRLSDPGKPATHAYFPTDGFVALVVQIEGNSDVAVGMVGREGMLGAQLALGVITPPVHALVQGPGQSWRISSEAFSAELAQSVALQRGINRYLHVLMVQLAQSSACLRFHLIGPRLARWLLMSQDRSHSNSFAVTQQFLAHMLGVRRVGITTAAGIFQTRGLIAYQRGKMTVLDRPGLEAAACSCFAADQDAYSKMLG